MPILDGKLLAKELQKELKEKISKISGRKPCLAFILIGEQPASQTYVKMKKKACEKIGIEYTGIELPESASEEKLLDYIKRLNKNAIIDGILVQLPLPPHINTSKVMKTIDPEKDVDGFHPVNVGKMLLGETDCFFPCTPYGIKVLLEKNNIPVEGKRVVIVGRSNIVGKPMAAMLMQNASGCNATITVLHSRSEHFKAICQTADILIAAVGKPKFITADMIKEQAVIVDVGINRVQENETSKIVGDVDFYGCSKKASYITPVPGGVGPMTITMLLKNTYQSYLVRNS